MKINRKGIVVDTEQLNFHKSSFSNQSGCVEVAEHKGHRVVRDSKDPNGPVLVFDAHEWTAFAAGVGYGEF
jgi:hypothetical protein